MRNLGSRSFPFAFRLFPILVAITVIFRFVSQFPFVSLLAFQARDIERARRVAEGAVFLWGPELTGGGTLPGGLYYWLMALPLAFGASWESAWLVFAILWALAWAATARWILRLAGWQASWLALVIFLSPATYLIFVNSACSTAFFILAELSFISAFAARSAEERGRAWMYGCLVSGLGVQLHLSGLAILAAGLVLYFLSRPLRIPYFPRRSFWRGIIFFFLPLLPFGIYFLAKMLGFQLGAAPYGGTGSASEALPSLINLAKGESGGQTFKEIFDRVTLLLPVALVSGAISFLIFRPERFERGLVSRTRRFWIPILTMAVFSFVPAVYVFIRPIGIRYVAPFAMCLVLLVPLFFRLVVRSRGRTIVFTMISLFFLPLFILIGRDDQVEWFRELAIVNLILFVSLLVFFRLRNRRVGALLQIFAILVAGCGGHFQQVANILPSFSRRAAPLKVDQIRFISELVISRTGWRFEEARKRLFFVNGQMHFSIELIYESVFASLKAAGKLPEKKSVTEDGFLIAQGMEIYDSPSPEALRAWLSKTYLQKDLRLGFSDREIELAQPIFQGNLIITSYRVIAKDEFPSSFQNIGYPYEENPQHGLFPESQDDASVRKMGDTDILFFWRSCPERWCKTGVRVNWRERSGAVEVDLSVIGAPLEQVSEWTGPGWGEMWSMPYIQVRCGERLSRKVILSSIGINQENTFEVGGMIQSYASILAPLERSMRFPCSEPLREISAGQQSVTLYTLDGPRVLKRPELVYSVR